jgi:hypothetical protein
MVIVLKNLDMVFAVAVAALAIALGAPTVGCIVGAGAWILQRGVQAVDKRWLRRIAKPTHQLGANLGEAFGRTWLLAGAIVGAGVGDARKDGLTAALIILGAYTIGFVIRLIVGKQREQERKVGVR